LHLKLYDLGFKLIEVITIRRGNSVAGQATHEPVGITYTNLTVQVQILDAFFVANVSVGGLINNL